MSARREYRPATARSNLAQLMQETAERDAKTSARKTDEALDKAAHELKLRRWAQGRRGGTR